MLNLTHVCLPQHIAQISKLENELFTDPWGNNTINETLESFGGGVLLALDDDNVLGYCIYSIVFEMAEILRIGVRKQSQGQGVAKRLMAEFIEFCKDKAVDNVLLEVRADNAPAIGLYGIFDFVQIDVRKGYYKDNNRSIDALILQKTRH